MLGLTRGRPSRVDLLPEAVKADLDTLLRDKKITQKEILDIVNPVIVAQGDAPLSPAGLNRYSRRMESAGGKIRQAREVAKQWVAALGSEPEGELGQLVIEFVRTLAFDTALQMTTGERPVEPKMLKDLAATAINLERAASEAHKRVALIRKEVLAQAAQNAERTAKKAGLSTDTVEQIKRDILGV